MTNVQVVELAGLRETTISHLLDESLLQGFRMIDRLLQDYNSAANRFDQSGEALFAATASDRVVGIGGLNRDPYFAGSKVGRVRHLYVESAWRRQGVGRLLVNQIIAEARNHYQLLTLRTDTAAADRFYHQLGFCPSSNWEHSTHHLQLTPSAYFP